MEAEVRDLSRMIKGNGQPGLDKVTRDFIAEWRGAEEERKKQRILDQQERSEQRVRDGRIEARWKWAIGIGISILLAWMGTLEVRHKIADTKPPAVVSHNQPEDSSLPPTYESR